MNRFLLKALHMKHAPSNTTRHAMHTLIVLFGVVTQIASAASLRLTGEQEAPTIILVNQSDGDVWTPSPVSKLTEKSRAPGYYTFVPHAAGSYYMQAHGQTLFDNDPNTQTRSDWSLGYDLTAFASTVISPAPDTAPVVLTALGLIGVMWSARIKWRPVRGSKAPG